MHRADPYLRKQVAAAAVQMCADGLTTGLDSGDVSVFDRDAGLIYALPAPSPTWPIRSWAHTRAEDVAIIKPDGEPVAESYTEPTVEIPMHLKIYEARPDVNAIVHSHAEDSQVFAAAELPIPTLTIDAYTRLGFGPVPCAKFGIVASQELGLNMVEVLGESGNCALMARHGAIAVGPDLDDALLIAVLLEKAARQALRVAQLGATPAQLTLEQIFDEHTARRLRSGELVLDVQRVTVREAR